MRIPLSWLGEFVDLKPQVSPEEIHEALVSVGFEEEDIHTFGITGPLVVGEILEFTEETHSNGKTIRWCQVRVCLDGRSAADGQGAVRGIVCGANNFIEGDHVVVALPGAVLLGNLGISARKTYGHISDGMIASAREIGLGDDHDGIIRLNEWGIQSEVGQDASVLLGLDDAAVEVNVTPDRGYAFSIRGIAREYAHATNVLFRDPAEAVDVSAYSDKYDRFSVSIEDQAPLRARTGVHSFVTCVVEDVNATAPTPAWMIARLSLAGIRPISLVVDITNYVMLELGQPLHAYDADKVSGGFVVRRAHAGEKLVTLDQCERELDVQDLVVADHKGVLGLAGVMGGHESQVTHSTRSVVIEAANFDSVSIARTARLHKLPSEASKRFERGVDPSIAPIAAVRAAMLLERFGGARVKGGLSFQNALEQCTIFLPEQYVFERTGVVIQTEQIAKILQEIGADVVLVPQGIEAVVPSWRPDLREKEDLVEEVIRLFGYDKIPALVPQAPHGRGLKRIQSLRRQAAWSFAYTGWSEVLAFPFVSQRANDLFGSEDEAHARESVRIFNPLDVKNGCLRQSLIPGLLDIAKRNTSRQLFDIAVYEMGKVFFPKSDMAILSELPEACQRPTRQELQQLEASLPNQPLHLAGVTLGRRIVKTPHTEDNPVGLGDVFEAIQNMSRAVGGNIRWEQAQHQGFHPGRCARLFVCTEHGEKQDVGYAGEILPDLAREHDLTGSVIAFEINLDAVLASTDEGISAGALKRTPAVIQDVSVLVDCAVPAGAVMQSLVDGAGALLEHIALRDEYQDPNSQDQRKSLTFSLRFRDAERTLAAREANEAKIRGVARAGERFGAIMPD